MELTLEQALRKGIEAHRAGNPQEADRYYTAILKTQPRHPDANHNMGVLAVGIGNITEALSFFRLALEANPNIAQFWLSFIDALIKLERIADAKDIIRQAKEAGVNEVVLNGFQKQLNTNFFKGTSKATINQDPPQAQIKVLFKFYEQGQYKEASSLALQLLSEFSHSSILYNIFGAANKNLGDLDQALEAFKMAIAIKPDNTGAYNNMGNALMGRGQIEEAIEAYTAALSINPENTEASYNLGNALKGINLKKPNKALQNILVSILDRKTYVRPTDITKAAISILKLDPTLKKHLKSVDGRAIEKPQNLMSDLSELPLLLKLMEICPLPDLDLEKLFEKIRHAILLNLPFLKEASANLIRFQSALALQCFTNEYIYNCTDEEKKTLRALEKTVKNALQNNKQPTPQVILTLASYKALNQYDWYKLLVVTEQIQEVHKRQVEEPIEEEKIRNYVPILKEITASVSSEVRAQYEERPYPKWVNLGLYLRPMSIANAVDQIELKLHENVITKVKKPEILIAGCGTGQHAIVTSTRFKSSQVLAIDLSVSSLAYANRKTKELGIENINYLQADILDLKELNQQFDIIECGGVLHHMDNPFLGWEVLRDCLKPGGLMKIGLYSELARQNIVTIKEELKKLEVGNSVAEMRSFRNTIIKSDKDHHKLVRKSADFYSFSELRDLLFHTKEHRFTIPLIKGHLDKLGLMFCGFESNNIISNFKQTYTYSNDLYDLDKWHTYEQSNPRIFGGMYQFWCQKVT